MSGAALPYHLRPHKAVDRRIFLDLLGRLERWRPLEEYVYVSMGAYPLEDHKLMHRILGITKLIAFDMEKHIVARQKFNKPLGNCHCLERTSGQVVDGFEGLLTECGFTEAEGAIVWLDYTDPKKLGEQIREFQTLLANLSVGDVLRVTVNAQPNELSENFGEKLKNKEEKRAKQFQVLKSRINDYLPSWATDAHMTAEELPKVIAGSFSAAALKALPTTSHHTFRPLSIVRYADGVQMLSITGTLIERSLESDMLARLSLDTWPFASDKWSDIHNLVVPDLTVRERLYLEREIEAKTTEDIVKDLGFDVASGINIRDFIETYKNYYRFYPTLLAAEL